MLTILSILALLFADYKRKSKVAGYIFQWNFEDLFRIFQMFSILRNCPVYRTKYLYTLKLSDTDNTLSKQEIQE